VRGESLTGAGRDGRPKPAGSLADRSREGQAAADSAEQAERSERSVNIVCPERLAYALDLEGGRLLLPPPTGRHRLTL
jgi:hypothetical protein